MNPTMAKANRIGSTTILRNLLRLQNVNSHRSVLTYTLHNLSCGGGRSVHVSAVPSTSTVHPPTDLSSQTRAIPKLSGAGPFPQDVQFEVLGAPYSLLSVSLPSSAVLYSRRGTLVGVNGRVENAVSSLSLLEPVRRAILRIPFLYQKIVSTSPLTCLISTNTLNSSFAVVKLEGNADWMVMQRKALLAWCGYSISVKPNLSRNMSVTHWGTSRVTGRGLVALVGRGQIFQVVLQPGEEFIIHQKNLLAYSLNMPQSPQQYRLHSHSFRLQIPKFDLGLKKLIPHTQFFRVMAQTDTVKAISKLIWAIRMWSRRAIWADREFLHLQGPVTILIQSRTSQIRDLFPKGEADDSALNEPGALSGLESKVGEWNGTIEQSEKPPAVVGPPAGIKKATVVKGKVILEDSDLQEFIKR